MPTRAENPAATATETATLNQVRDLLSHHLHALWATPGQAGLIPPLMLWGPPGVGKSSVIRTLCRELGIGFIDVRLAQREPVDLRGLPVPQGDQVRWLLSSEWPRDADSRGIILFDELTAADRSLQVAAYEFILDRRLGDLYRVPDGWYLCGAGNRAEDGAVAVTLSSALANRFCHVEVTPDLDTWLPWAHARGVHPDVLGFLRFRPAAFFDMSGDLERGWPSPRSWERVGLELRLAEERGLDEAVLRLIVTGLVGVGAATEFFAFRRWSIDLDQVNAMLRGEARVSVPRRADQRYALCSALVSQLWHGPDAGSPQVLDGFFRVSQELPSDFAGLAMTDALAGETAQESEVRAELLFGHPGFADWSRRHGSAFAEHQEALV
jgi:hypothetical protein